MRPPWTALTATGDPWDPAKLFVLWRPRRGPDGSPILSDSPLLDGHPGVVVDSSWQDVGVVWVGLEHDEVTTASFFDTRDLEQVAAERFARAVLNADAIAPKDDSGHCA